METTSESGTLTEFSALAAWMRNEGIHRLFVGDCYCCDWSNIDGSKFDCEIPQAPEIIRETWKMAQESFRSASQDILKKQYPKNDDDWEYTFLESMELNIDCNEWNILARVWFQTDEETIDSGRKELISTEGHVNWSAGSSQAWGMDIKAFTHVECIGSVD